MPTRRRGSATLSSTRSSPTASRRPQRVVKPGTLEPWDAPPTVHGFKGGDLLGIAEHLGYLEDLGITAIYLTPIFASAANHRYHTYDYLAVDPLLGGDAALRELLDAAHDRGMRVILDGVFNHTGRGFWPFHHVLENGIDSPYTGWFHLDEAALRAGRPLLAYPPAGTPTAALGYEAWWGLPGAAQAEHGRAARCASTCSAWRSTGSASGSTAGDSTSRPRSTTSRSGRSSGRAADGSAPMPTWSARSGRWRRTGSGAIGSTR